MEKLLRFDPEKIITGEIDPNAFNPSYKESYEVNNLGIVIIDKNKDTTGKYTLINLNARKYSEASFRRIIETEFEEFTELIETRTQIQELQDLINQLTEEVNRLQVEKSTDQNQINSLLREINRLQREIENIEMDNMNEIPDTLPADGFLFSNRPDQNSLLSQNRTAKATILPDGNFVVVIGEFSQTGEKLREDGITFQTRPAPRRGSNYFVNVQWGTGGRILVGELNSNQTIREVYFESPAIKTTKSSRLVLDDNGYLNLFDNRTLVWTSYG